MFMSQLTALTLHRGLKKPKNCIAMWPGTVPCTAKNNPTVLKSHCRTNSVRMKI